MHVLNNQPGAVYQTGLIVALDSIFASAKSGSRNCTGLRFVCNLFVLSADHHFFLENKLPLIVLGKTLNCIPLAW